MACVNRNYSISILRMHGIVIVLTLELLEGYLWPLTTALFGVAGDVMDVYDAASRYKAEGKSVIVLAGKDYGSGARSL